MAQKVGGLFVSLAASSARFAADMAKARSSAKTSSSGIKKGFDLASKSGKSFTKSLGGLKAGVLAVAGPAALGLLIKRSIDIADKTVKVADKIGISTDALQEYRFAAQLAGVEQSALDMGMQRFVRRAAEAAQGVGELRGTLDFYGIAVRDANGQTRQSTDILDDLADVIMNAESEQEQLRISFKAFDSEGAALVNMLRKGSIGLDEYRVQAHKLGIIIDEDLLRGAEAAKDQFTIMGRVISTQLTTAVLTLAPQITTLTKNLTDGLPAIIAWINNFLRWSGLMEDSPIQALERELEAVNDELRTAKEDVAWVDRVDTSFARWWDKVKGLSTGYKDLLAKQEELKKKIKDVEEAEAKAHAAAVTAAQTEADQMVKKIQTASEFQKAEEKKKQDIKEFSELFKALTTEEFELRRKLLEEDLEAWEAAGASKTELDKLEAEKRKKIADDELQHKLGKAQELFNNMGKVADALFNMEKQQIDQKLEHHLDNENTIFENEIASIKRRNSVGGELTEQGLRLTAEAETRFARTKDTLREKAVQDEKRAARRGQAIRIAQATANTAVAVIKALDAPPPLNFINAALVGAAGALQIATIKRQKFAKGGVISAPTFFSMPNGGGLGEAGEQPGRSEGILPLARMAGGNLGIEASGIQGDIILQQQFNFEGITEEKWIKKKVIPTIEDAAKKGMTEILTNRNPKKFSQRFVRLF